MKTSILSLVGIVLFSIGTQCWAESFKGGNCEIWNDDQGIPHIRANHELEGMACLGFVHARERGFQVDYFRRMAQGRHAEIYGKDSIPLDFIFRLIGLEEKAESVYKDFDPHIKALLEAYSEGVNRGFKEALKRESYEFKRLGYAPEKWRPQDTVTLILLQSFEQTIKSFAQQLQEMVWLKAYGDEAFQLFDPEGLPWSTTILKEGEYPKSETSTSHTNPPKDVEVVNMDLQKVWKELGGWTEGWVISPGKGLGAGSNNWVVSPQRSQSGNAWLANDPHLQLSHPPFWHMVHINAGSWDTMGATAPGIPIIASGTNRNVSWGLTDAFLPATRLSYVDENELKKAKVIRPTIWVKVGRFQLPFFMKTFRRTPGNLPLLPVPGPLGKAAVLKWSGYDLKGSDFKGLFELIGARSSEEMDQILSRILVPCWNFVFADTQGSIGYRAVGRTPRFQNDPPYAVPVESLDAVENSPAFANPLTAEEMPHLLNPKRGYIATANNQQWPSDSQWSGGKAQELSFRAFRIEELLQQSERHDLKTFQRIQCDVQSMDGRFIGPELMSSLQPSSLTESELTTLRTLQNWNYETDVNCKECALYRHWNNVIFIESFLNEAALYRKLTQRSPDPLQSVLLSAFRMSLLSLNYFQKEVFPAWGTVHVNSFGHVGGDSYFKDRPLGTPGDQHTVNFGMSLWTGKNFSQLFGSSQRMIVEMSQPPKVYSMLAGPNQDIEVRQHNRPEEDWQKWVNCELYPRHFPVDWSLVPETEKVSF